MAYDESTAARVRDHLAGQQGISEKTLMGGRCFMAGQSMCCSVSGSGGLLVRISPDGYEAALAKTHVEPMMMGRRTMRGFVCVAPDGYRTAAQLAKWLALGLAAARAQPPKPSRQKIRPAGSLTADSKSRA